MIDLRLGNCIDIMSTFPDKSIDVVVTDPPYGCGKADWDDSFPTEWYKHAKRIARMVVIITGSSGLADTVPLVGSDFVDVISAWNKNGMTRSPIGFGNWLAAVIACGKPRRGQNFLWFTVNSYKPDHPSPKPMQYMMKLIERVTETGQTVFDPFMGSGTTGVACASLNRNFIGCDVNESYVALSRKRIDETLSKHPRTLRDNGLSLSEIAAQLKLTVPEVARTLK